MPSTRKSASPFSRREALDSDYTALYAVAGLTEALAEVLKTALAETQDKATERFAELQHRRQDLREQARGSAAEMRTFVITLPEQVKHLPEATKIRLAELQQQANELKTQANSTYVTLAGRGKRVVADTVTEAADRVDPLLEKVQQGVTVARRTVTKPAPETASPETTIPEPAPKTAAEAAAKRRAAGGTTSAPSPEVTAKRQAAAKKAAATRAAKKAATAAAVAQADLAE